MTESFRQFLMQATRDFHDGDYIITRFELDSGPSTPFLQPQPSLATEHQQPFQHPTSIPNTAQVANAEVSWPGSIDMSYGGLPSPSTCTSATETSDGDDDVGCMLHDRGEWCAFCGDVPETSRTEKYGGKPKVVEITKLDLGSCSGSLFEDIYFSSLTSQNWLHGLGGPPPERPQVRPKANGEDDKCGTCKYPTSRLIEMGPGFCKECRYRWLDLYHAENAIAAGVRPAKSKFTKGGKGKGKGSRYDWRSLGY